MTDSERIRKILGISRAEFSRRYHIPIRTLEQWDKGVATPPVYVMEMLERIVKEDKDMLYALILSTRGNEEVVAVGTREEMVKREDPLRKECRKYDPDGAEMDCYIISEAEARKVEEGKKLWESLTEEDKKDIIEIDGRKYVRKIWERNH